MARDEKDVAKRWLTRVDAGITRKAEWEKQYEVGT